MSAANWHDLLPNIEAFPSTLDPKARLTAEQAKQLESISLSAESYGRTLGFGISAIGHLLVYAAQADSDVSAKAAINLGWLLESLGDLSVLLADVGEGAREKLTAIKREG